MLAIKHFDADGFRLKFRNYCPEEDIIFCIKKFPRIDVVAEMKNHCTSCDTHIGTAPSSYKNCQVHRSLEVTQCFSCYNCCGSVEIVNSELYCQWCGQRCEVLCCCTKCPYAFCETCIRRNLSDSYVNLIYESTEWSCFVCDRSILQNERAQHWALKNFMRKQFQKINRRYKKSGRDLEILQRNDVSTCALSCLKEAKTKTKLNIVQRGNLQLALGKAETRLRNFRKTEFVKARKYYSTRTNYSKNAGSSLAPTCFIVEAQKSGTWLKKEYKRPPTIPSKRERPATISVGACSSGMAGISIDLPATTSESTKAELLVPHAQLVSNLEENDCTHSSRFDVSKLFTEESEDYSAFDNFDSIEDNYQRQQCSPFKNLFNTSKDDNEFSYIRNVQASTESTYKFKSRRETYKDRSEGGGTYCQPRMRVQQNRASTKPQLLKAPNLPDFNPSSSKNTSHVRTSTTFYRKNGKLAVFRAQQPDTPFGKSKAEFEEKIIGAIKICHNTFNKLIEMNKSKNFVESGNFSELNEHFVHLLSSTTEKFTNLQEIVMSEVKKVEQLAEDLKDEIDEASSASKLREHSENKQTAFKLGDFDMSKNFTLRIGESKLKIVDVKTVGAESELYEEISEEKVKDKNVEEEETKRLRTSFDPPNDCTTADNNFESSALEENFLVPDLQSLHFDFPNIVENDVVRLIDYVEISDDSDELQGVPIKLEERSKEDRLTRKRRLANERKKKWRKRKKEMLFNSDKEVVNMQDYIAYTISEAFSSSYETQ